MNLIPAPASLVRASQNRGPRSASGMYYYGYRYFDPVTGRWPSRDPVGERGGVNLYRFVANDAVNSSDFVGLLKLTFEKITTRDLKPGKESVPPFPGAKPSEIIENSLAFCNIEWEVVPKCKCIEAKGAYSKYWILEEYDVKVFARIRLLAEYKEEGQEAWVKKNEDEHAAIIQKWVEGNKKDPGDGAKTVPNNQKPEDSEARKTMQKVEDDYSEDVSKNRFFESDKQCVDENKKRFLKSPSILQSLKDAHYESEKLDMNHGHDWDWHKRRGTLDE